MKGRIISYKESRGLVAGFDTMRYGFAREDWRGPGEPEIGADIEFRIDGMSAREIGPRAAASAIVPRAVAPAADAAPAIASTDMDFADAFNACFEKFATFSGRARRREYWFFVLFVFLAHFVALLVGAVLFGAATTSGPLSILLSLALTLPWLAVTVRRMHDVGHAGTWAVLVWAANTVLWMAGGFIPRIDPILDRPLYLIAWAVLLALLGGSLWIFALTLRRGTPGSNRYGPDPLSSPADVF